MLMDVNADIQKAINQLRQSKTKKEKHTEYELVGSQEDEVEFGFEDEGFCFIKPIKHIAPYIERSEYSE